MNHPYQKLESLPIWNVVSDALSDLVENQDISITTNDKYVIGYLLSKIVVDTPVVIDWSTCRSEAEFYDIALPQCGSPTLHGRNLDALADSWITGGIDTGGPPFEFYFRNCDKITPELVEFRDAVERIAWESVSENGGHLTKQKAEQVRDGNADEAV
jgi:hypothetical protein